jgi:hypothetical protein
MLVCAPLHEDFKGHNSVVDFSFWYQIKGYIGFPETDAVFLKSQY